MQFTVNRKKFLKELGIAGNFVDLKTEGQFNGVLIKAEEIGKLIITATGRKDAVRYEARAVCVNGEGCIFVGFNRLKLLLNSIVSNEVVFEDRSLKFDGGRTDFEPLSMEEAPKFPESDEARELYKIPSKELKRMLSDIMPAMSVPTDFPKYMGTCLWRSEEGCITVVTTDGKKLGLARYFSDDIKRHDDLILSADSVKGLEKLADIFGESAEFFIDDERLDERIWVKSKGIEFSARPKDGINFPLYERILNTDVEMSLRCRKKDLESVIKSVYAVAKNTTSKIIGFKFYPGQGVIIGAHSEKAGDMITTFSKCEIEGKYLMLGFNGKYLLDALKMLGDCEILIEFSGNEGQARFYRTDDKKGLEYLMMPCRLSPAELRVIDICYPT